MAEPETSGPGIEEPGMSVSVCPGARQIFRRSGSNNGVEKRSWKSPNEGVGLAAEVTDVETGTAKKPGIRGENPGVPDVTASITELRETVPSEPAGAVTDGSGKTVAASETA